MASRRQLCLSLKNGYIFSTLGKMYKHCRLPSSHVRTHRYSYVLSITPALYLLCMGMLGVWGVGEGVLALPSPSAAGPEPLRTTPSRSESLVEAGRVEKRENGKGGRNQKERERSQCEGWRTQRGHRHSSGKVNADKRPSGGTCIKTRILRVLNKCLVGWRRRLCNLDKFTLARYITLR